MNDQNEKPAPIMRETISAEEAAQLLGISYWKLNELAKAGKIPFIAIGNRRLFRRTTLEKWFSDLEAMLETSALRHI